MSLVLGVPSGRSAASNFASSQNICYSASGSLCWEFCVIAFDCGLMTSTTCRSIYILQNPCTLLPLSLGSNYYPVVIFTHLLLFLTHSLWCRISPVYLIVALFWLLELTLTSLFIFFYCINVWFNFTVYSWIFFNYFICFLLSLQTHYQPLEGKGPALYYFYYLHICSSSLYWTENT